MLAPNTLTTLDPDRLASAIERLPAEQRAALRWAPVAFAKPIRELLEVEPLDRSACLQAAATFMSYLPRVLLAIASVDQDRLLARSLAEDIAGRTTHIDQALPYLQRTDIVAEHLCLWMRAVLSESWSFDQKLITFLLRPQFLSPTSEKTPQAPDLAAELCLMALDLGVRERVSSVRLHTLAMLGSSLLAEWIEKHEELLDEFGKWVEGPDLLDDEDREHATQGLRVLEARHETLQKHIAIFHALEEASRLVAARQWSQVISLLEEHDLEDPSSAPLASLHQRATSGRALPVVLPGQAPMLPSSGQIRTALANAGPDDAWIAVNPEGQSESARTLPELEKRITGREKDMLLIGRGERPDAV